MAAKSELSIRAAVMNLIARCTDSAAPLCCLNDFLEKLAALGWNLDDIKAVETAALRMLANIKGFNLADSGGTDMAAS
jgi:hypothetical protein